MSQQTRKTVRSGLFSLLSVTVCAATGFTRHASGTTIAVYAAVLLALDTYLTVRVWRFYGNPDKVAEQQARIDEQRMRQRMKL
ncbi:hypothetical protein [Streptacidiphilus sp. EB129]|uniref:hypothetical protein n=1 Tax=Streptacidiphilus sp. EB129 TaxID=3156262 RepID=UPI003518BFCF